MARRKSSGLTTSPVEYRMPGRTWYVYVVPPSVGRGSDVARPGMRRAPSPPETFRNPTRPSFVMTKICQARLSYATAVSMVGRSSPPGGCSDTSRSVPPRWDGARARTATHSVFPAAASAEGALPTAMLFTSRVPVMIREIVPSNSLATHTTSAVAATPLGPSPVDRAVTEFVPGSILETVPSRRLATHTPSARTASPAGPLPALYV